MAKTISTIHNPTNFEPTDYTVEDYLDNQHPKYFGQNLDLFEHEQVLWRNEMTRTFGADYINKIHHCIHCGNSNVRWITAVRHLPTNEVVVFGSDCTERLGFANKVAFKLAQLQARAEARKVRFVIYNKRTEFLTANPAIADALTHIEELQHTKNFFAKDVLRKLDQWGVLSVAQVNAVINSLQRDNDYAARAAAEAVESKGAAPSGRVEVTGIVLSVKNQESAYYEGIVTKLLIKLANNSKVWCTRPSGSSIERGDTVTIKATWTVSPTDTAFSFGKRPILINRVAV